MLTLVVGTVLLLQAAAPDSLSLAQALTHARTHRAQLRAAGAGVAEARAGVGAASVIPNPTLGYSYTDDAPRQHLVVQQTLDWLLTRGAERRAASRAVDRAAADSALIEATLGLEIRSAFYGALAGREARRLAEEQARAADSAATLAAHRFELGEIPQVESLRLALEASRVQQELSRGREGEQRSASALARAIGWGAGALPPVTGQLDADLDAAVSSTSADLARVPAIRRAEADSASAAALARSAGRARIPLPSVEFGADWADPSQRGQTLWLFGVSLPLPLWHRGGAVAAGAAARAEQSAALLSEARMEVRSQVEVARVRLAESAIRARRARDTLLPAAALLRAKALTGYQLGETGVLPVLDALRAERETAALALDDLLAFQEALASWHALTGTRE
ncbi:MAG: TolC family protein [Gemmatimonadales bacterium]